MLTVDRENEMKNRVLQKLSFLYGEDKGSILLQSIVELIEQYKTRCRSNSINQPLSEKDAVLIVYGDQIIEEGKQPLASLREFLNEKIKGTIHSVHVLPFYPYSSDDGFSVIDYFEVNPALGEWKDIEVLSADFNLMFDAVVNHISAKSPWFQSYLNEDPKFRGYFIEADPNEDYSKVTRPRALPLLTKFQTSSGEEKHIWTTFSDDQVDLNFKNEQVLICVIELLLFYVSKGAKLIRLDAIGYLWKRAGSTCIHLEETHAIVQLFRDIFEILGTNTLIITETNVPHQDNISYFGDGFNESHMVYQFSLPPLTLHAFHTGDATRLSEWAESLKLPSNEVTYFNFLSSHDGIGVMPAKGILSDGEIDSLIAKIAKHGGHVSYKYNPDGSQSPYELNCNYFDALSDPDEEDGIRVARFMASQSILLAFQGVPGIYFHSLFGSRNDHKGVEKTGRLRSINREKLYREELQKELSNPESIRYKVFHAYKAMLNIRCNEKAFHPHASQQVLFLNQHVFSVMRSSIDNQDRIVCLTNVSAEQQEIEWPLQNGTVRFSSAMKDLISQQTVQATQGTLKIRLEGYQTMWMKEIL